MARQRREASASLLFVLVFVLFVSGSRLKFLLADHGVRTICYAGGVLVCLRWKLSSDKPTSAFLSHESKPISVSSRRPCSRTSISDASISEKSGCRKLSGSLTEEILGEFNSATQTKPLISHTLTDEPRPACLLAAPTTSILALLTYLGFYPNEPFAGCCCGRGYHSTIDKEQLGRTLPSCDHEGLRINSSSLLCGVAVTICCSELPTIKSLCAPLSTAPTSDVGSSQFLGENPEIFCRRCCRTDDAADKGHTLGRTRASTMSLGLIILHRLNFGRALQVGFTFCLRPNNHYFHLAWIKTTDPLIWCTSLSSLLNWVTLLIKENSGVVHLSCASVLSISLKLSRHFGDCVHPYAPVQISSVIRFLHHASCQAFAFKTTNKRALIGLFDAVSFWSSFGKCETTVKHLDPIEDDFLGVYQRNSMLSEQLSFLLCFLL